METRVVGPLTFTIDFSIPLYEQIVEQIRHAVARGEIALGKKLPSVREMAQNLKVNPSTVVRAYLELEHDGLCEKRRGQGTFITNSEEKVQKIKRGLAEEALNNFVHTMKSLGIDKNTAQQWLKEMDWQ
ncbi:GntR family transcriptional regulator [Thermoflavimicrobium daqui]|jgi:GntR family transcriptional regulator|uniref:GntR family transcriptional regulator n=1 Tax=Thermoflavimicrobium daqui TaxID=2137476 RepID=A0A364K1Z3_9BACL|nr:GntR family transcriptional regulator [Thermoflavimicrobium daqui]RAL22052.1 GntR family transcriptional regulator [Thermoflavimicrobium daqui]